MGYFILLTVICAGFWAGICKKRAIYRKIDCLLDCVLNQEQILASQVQEGDFSALVNKVERIQGMMDRQVECAREEKEQVKSLVSNMSHQLKTPLANLSVYADILEAQELDEEKKQEITGRMKRQVEKLDWIIGSLGKMVKLEQDVITFEAENCFVRQTILDAVDAVFEKVEKKEINIILEPYEDLPVFHNRKWTAEVFVNILENAVKYTKRGGTIQIKVKPFEIYTEIQFADNGRGICKEEIPQIFRRFYRGKNAENVEGSGIGLYLSNLILEKEKGYMTVKSEQGEGSCFSVFLRNG